MGDWVAGKQGWLKGHVKEKPKASVQTEKPKDDVFSVTYVPVKCPKCRSKNCRCYGKDGPVKYYKCRNPVCGIKFKAFEGELP